MKWLDFELPQNWGSAKKFTVAAQTTADKAPFTVLSQLLDEWIAASSGALIAPVGLEPQAGEVKLHAACESDTGHWLASLWVLLSDARWKTSVRKAVITVDEPSNLSSRA